MPSASSTHSEPWGRSRRLATRSNTPASTGPNGIRAAAGPPTPLMERRRLRPPPWRGAGAAAAIEAVGGGAPPAAGATASIGVPI